MSTLHSDPRRILSCTTCHRRKLKCDKQLPCSNCKKSRYECDYPASRRQRRSSKIESNSALRNRVEKLENLIQDLHKQIAAHNIARREPSHNPENDLSKLPNKIIGVFVNENGESRYVGNSFWLALCSLPEIRNIIDEHSDENNDIIPSAHDLQRPKEPLNMYNLSPSISSLNVFHPKPDETSILWRVFVANIDPIVKILHKPTMEKLLTRSRGNTAILKSSSEALLFSIYFASITSLTDAQTESLFHERKSELLDRFRFGVQQALSQANFLSSHNVVTLQAIVLFLVCERNHDHTGFVWTLTGVAIRIAQSLGLHHDASSFQFPFFDAEIRRRIWWQLYMLDARLAENHGFDQDITVQQIFDTKLPLNINDSDLIPGSTTPPTPKSEITEMSTSLMRCEIVNALTPMMSQLKSLQAKGQRKGSFAEDIDEVTNACRERIQALYLKHCDMAIPFHWFLSTASRVILAKAWISIYHRFKIEAEGKLTEQAKTRILQVSVEIVDSCLLLERANEIIQWKWILRNYVPWQAMAFILLHICEYVTENNRMDLEWDLVHNAFNEWVYGDKLHSCLWRRLKLLKEKVEKVRESRISKPEGVDTSAGKASSVMRTNISDKTTVGEPGIATLNPDDQNDFRIFGVTNNPQVRSQLEYEFYNNDESLGYSELDTLATADWGPGTAFEDIWTRFQGQGGGLF